MFKSKIRPIIVPQSEHLKLAGEISFSWGNSRFDSPPLPRLAFVEGVALHDRGYGYLDTLPIGEADEADWLEVARKGFYMPASDPVADIVTRMHLLRLVKGQDTPARNQFAQEKQAEIDRQIGKSGVSEIVFQRADRITNFCDRVSFDFCFEKPTTGEIAIYPRNGSDEQVKVQYELTGENIYVTPWPLSVDEVRGYLVGYKAEGYPESLEPVLMPYRIRFRDSMNKHSIE